MSALEDIELEETRNILGALAILTQNSSGVNYQEFVPNFIGGITMLRKQGYVKDVNNNDDRNQRYQLTDLGWAYARKVLDSASKIL